MDGNQDGQLTGDEIPARMQEVIDRFDSDSDGAISKDEFLERMRQFRSQRTPERERARERPSRPE